MEFCPTFCEKSIEASFRSIHKVSLPSLPLLVPLVEGSKHLLNRNIYLEDIFLGFCKNNFYDWFWYKQNIFFHENLSQGGREDGWDELLCTEESRVVCTVKFVNVFIPICSTALECDSAKCCWMCWKIGFSLLRSMELSYFFVMCEKVWKKRHKM